MRKIGVSTLKILAFIGLWSALTAGVVMTIVALGGRDFYAKIPYRVALEGALCAATILSLVILARFLDRRPLSSIGFSSARLIDLLQGALLGAAIFWAPLGILIALGAARFNADIGGFSAPAMALGLFVCLLNVTTQEVLVRSYVFQELWAKYGASVGTIVTTLLFLALHANPISQGVPGLIAGANILIASLLLSLAYVRTGALWLSIGIHFGWNGLQGPVLGINVTGQDLGFSHWSLFSFPGAPLLTGGRMGVEGSLIGLIGPALGILFVALAVKPRPKPGFGSPMPGRPLSPAKRAHPAFPQA
jgi:membrane protease YdiL (CAAX protease family)